MKRNFFDDEREKKVRKAKKGTEKLDKHKKRIYNMLMETENEPGEVEQKYNYSYTKQR